MRPRRLRSKIERDLLWIKWMTGVLLAGVFVLVLKAFAT
jgi:hypothetical protein